MTENYPITVHAGGTYAAPAAPPKAELRTLENPSTPLSAPDDWLYDALGSYRASSGVNVNSQTALTYPPFWRGVNLISGDVGRLPLYYYRRLKRGREQAQDQPLFRLLRYKPNSEMTAMVFRKTLQSHILVQGNGYAYISRSGSGRPLELIPLNPTQCYPIRRNGELWYVLDIPNAEMRKIRPADILHLKGLSHDGMLGYSVMAKARESLGLAMALQTYSAVFFRNNARPNIALEYPDGMRPEAVQTLRENWERLHSGLENAHKVALLKGGVKLITYGVNARDAMLIEAAKMSVRDTANLLCVPPHKLGDDGKSSYNSLEQENQDYLDSGLDPHLVTWEEEIWDKLLTDEEKEEYFAEFDRRALLRANLQARGAYYKDAVAGGWLSPNEVREEEGDNPRADPEGDKYCAPQYGYAGDPPPARPGQPGQPGMAANAAATGPAPELINVPDIRQQDNYSCGAACAMAVGQYFGVGPKTLEEWKTALGTTAKESTRPFAIAQYLTELGLAVSASSALTIEDLQACWKRGAPVICPIQEYGVPSKQSSFAYGHYVVVTGAALGYVFVQDPSIDNVLEGEDADQAPGKMMIAEADWMRVWHDVDADGKEYVQFGIVVAKELPKEPEPAPPAQSGTKSDTAKPAPPAKKKKQASSPRLIEVHRQLLIDAAARMGKRLAVHGRKAAKKPEDFAKFLAELDADHAATMVEVLGPPLRAAGLVIGRAVNVKQFVAEMIENFRRDLAECQAKNNPVEQSLVLYENSFPYILANAFMALDQRAKPDKPSRTTDEALDILSRLPDVDGKEGEISLTMPAVEKPPYDLDVEDLKDAKKKVVKLRKLIGTRATLKRKRVADFIKNPDAYTKGRDLDKLPTDRPYIVRYQGKLYIHDGHHRLMARQLLATVKTKVYYYEVD